MLKRALVIVGFYALLALITLYNPLFHLDGFVTGHPVTDYYHFHWNYWWMRHAFSNGLNIYLTNYVFAPFTNNLAFHTLTPFFYPIWALIEPFAGTVAAMTAIFVTAMTASASAFYALLRREGVSVGLALVGGAMLELTPLMLTAVYWTNINLMGWFWLPLLILVWGWMGKGADSLPDPPPTSGEGAITPDSCRDQKRRPIERAWGRTSRRKLTFGAIALGLMLWGMVLTDLQYPLFNAFVIVPYGLWVLVRVGNWHARIRLVMAETCGVGIALALLWFAGPLPYILSFETVELSPTPAERAVSVPFPQGFFWHYDPLANYEVSVGAVLLPLIVVAIALSHLERRRRRATPPPTPPRIQGGAQTDLRLARGLSKAKTRFPIHLSPSRWFWLALVPIPLILAAGASITVAGVQITLPYVWLHHLMGGMFRYPERFVPVLLIPGVLFAMLTLTAVLARMRRVWRWIIPAALMFVVIADARILAPFPIQPLPTPYSFYEKMGAEPYDYVVLEVPTAGMSGEGIVGDSRWVVTQFYGMTHGKRMVNGHLSRVPISHYWYMRTDDSMMAWLGGRRYIEPEAVEQQFRQRIYDYPIGYVVIHRDWIGVGSVTDQEVIGYLNSLQDLLCPVWVEGDAVVYRTAWHPDGCPSRTPPQDANGDFVIDVGSPDDERYTGWGWHYAEQVGGLSLRWTGEYPQADVYLDLPPNEYDLTITAQAFHEPRELTVRVNSEAVGTATVAVEPMQAYHFTIPVDVIGDGQHLTLTLDYDATVTPAAVGLGDDPRKLAIAVDTIRFAPK